MSKIIELNGNKYKATPVCFPLPFGESQSSKGFEKYLKKGFLLDNEYLFGNLSVHTFHVSQTPQAVYLITDKGSTPLTFYENRPIAKVFFKDIKLMESDTMYFSGLKLRLLNSDYSSQTVVKETLYFPNA